MTISFAQIVVLLLIGFLIFGDLTKLKRSISKIKKKFRKKES